MMLDFEDGLYQIWDIHQRGLVGTKHVIYKEAMVPSRSDYGQVPIRCRRGDNSQLTLTWSRSWMYRALSQRPTIALRTETGAIIILPRWMILMVQKNRLQDIYKMKEQSQIDIPILRRKARKFTADVFKRRCCKSKEISRNRQLIKS